LRPRRGEEGDISGKEGGGLRPTLIIAVPSPGKEERKKEEKKGDTALESFSFTLTLAFRSARGGKKRG